MQRSARTAHTMRPSRSGSSTMQPATGQAAWQIEHANAPKQRSGSMTAIVFGAFLRAPVIIFVHMSADYTLHTLGVLDRDARQIFGVVHVHRGVLEMMLGIDGGHASRPRGSNRL